MNVAALATSGPHVSTIISQFNTRVHETFLYWHSDQPHLDDLTSETVLEWRGVVGHPCRR